MWKQMKKTKYSDDLYMNQEEIQRKKEQEKIKSALKIYDRSKKLKPIFDKSNIKSIKKDLADKTGPKWYQELSEEQLKGADAITKCLIKDSQCIIQKCNDALFKIGLRPLPTNADLLKAVEFSRGNDLAFLWFLFEVCYSSCEVVFKAKGDDKKGFFK